MNPFRLSAQTRAASSSRARAPTADVVPWRVTQRTSDGVVEVRHCGPGPLHSVRFTLAGGGLLGLSLPRTVFPRERLRVLVRGEDAESALGAADALLVLRWFQPDGQELLWPIAL